MKRKTDFSRCDLFGQAIALTFKGQSDYRSVFGSIMSIGCVLVFAIFFSIRTKALLSGENAFMFVSAVNRRDEAFDLLQLGYTFAVKAIPSEIGTISLKAWSQRNSEHEAGESVDIPLTKCSQDATERL